jgi:hypothetical protein
VTIITIGKPHPNLSPPKESLDKREGLNFDLLEPSPLEGTNII